nr:hypothetical protein [Tanacetum cinerariifolium]
MSAQQDIYATGSENRHPMLNKENYVPWSSRLLLYAKSRPNRKLIYNSIINGPYVRQMIPEPSDQNREVPMNETFHEQTDDELTEKELKQVEADDQAIQTILLGLPEDIYAAVDSSRAEGNAIGNNGNQIRCYNYRGLGHLARNCTVRPRRRDVSYLQTQLLIAQKEEQASTSATQTDKAPVYDSNGSAEECLGLILLSLLGKKCMCLTKLEQALGQNQSLYHNLITKKVVNSDSNSFSSTGVDNTDKTKRPQPRSNTKNDRAPFASKSSCNKNKEVEVKEPCRNLLLSKNKKHMSSKCNNVKLAIRNDKSEVVCAMCKKCLITANHDVCVLHVALRTAMAAQAPQVLQTLTTTTIADTVPTPTNSSSQAVNFLNTSQDVDELETQQQNVQHQPVMIAGNVPNAMLNGNTFVNPFATPS